MKSYDFKINGNQIIPQGIGKTKDPKEWSP